ncbi:MULTISPECIES: DUF2478 domain-containing protein [unclassified Meridianimarinicoccus]|uniref:DUF2478 domain-containing protein n=1 Tax=unclassified Meridianimarinicoccus TaxID=2923344 RepID=UPI001868ADDD|nr:DUF2478 domain-containing protein [Fluviibacterium sp. MJW13]
MKIAYISSADRGGTDRLLEQFSVHLQAQGARLCGIVQTNTDCGPGPCDMDVRVLPDGPIIRISQSLGPQARGCRLDTSALEHSVAATENSFDAGADLLILNKFGKHEADGRGFRTMIARAISEDVPVLLAVNGLNLPAFEAFTDGMARRVDADLEALTVWFESLGATDEVA